MRRSIVAVVLVATATLIGGCASEAGGDITGKTWHLTTVAKFGATVVMEVRCQVFPVMSPPASLAQPPISVAVATSTTATIERRIRSTPIPCRGRLVTPLPSDPD